MCVCVCVCLCLSGWQFSDNEKIVEKSDSTFRSLHDVCVIASVLTTTCRNQWRLGEVMKSLFKSLFLKTNLNCSCVLLLDIYSIIMQWGFCKYVLSKNIKTDIFFKSAFANRKLIVIF